MLKELIDNAIDFIESGTHSDTDFKPQVTVTIKLDNSTIRESKTISLIIRNSNPNNRLVGKDNTAEAIQTIFQIGRYYSSKRNVFRITKGALGDALKEILCIPYALAEDLQINWKIPLIIRNAGKEFRIYLQVDKFNDTNPISTKVTESVYNIFNATEIEVTLPIIKDIVHNTFSLYRFTWDYTIPTTHIRFVLQDLDEDINNSMTLDATQQINTRWKNNSSAHWYRRPEFHRLLLGLSKENTDSETYRVLYNIIRETSNLKRDDCEVSILTLGEIVRSTEKMNLLHSSLKKSMNPSTTLSLPFDTAKRLRQKALKERIEQCLIGHTVNNSQVKYRQAFGVYTDTSTEDNVTVQIPYYYEIMIFHDLKDIMSSTLGIKQALNCSAVPTSAPIFSGERFDWYPTSSAYRWTAINIMDIMEHYGYSYNKKTCKKPYSLIFINLVCPKIAYQSYGKSKINIGPFISTVAETTVKVCMGGGRSLDGKPSKSSILEEVLRERQSKWYSLTPLEKQKSWWTMSDVFYATRKKLIEEHGYNNDEISREYITGLIRSTCEDTFHVKREDIGIIAADRAQLYFKGKWMDVGLEEIKDLVQYGTDMLIIEKEGVVEQLKSFADEDGIALLNTRGFLTEYADILQEKAGIEGCNIAILTDLDISGLMIAAKVPNAFRVGIDFDTLEYLGLDIKKVEEKYIPPSRQASAFDEGSIYNRIYSQEIINYVQDKRVEINSVLVELDDNGEFWEWIIDQLREQFPYRDCTRSTEIPDYVVPGPLQELNDKVQALAIIATRKHVNQLRDNLSNINGFLFDRTNDVLPEDKRMTIKEYDKIIADHIQHIIESNEDIKSLLDKISIELEGVKLTKACYAKLYPLFHNINIAR